MTERYGERSSGMEMIVEKMTESEGIAIADLAQSGIRLFLDSMIWLTHPNIKLDVHLRIEQFARGLDDLLKELKKGLDDE